MAYGVVASIDMPSDFDLKFYLSNVNAGMFAFYKFTGVLQRY